MSNVPQQSLPFEFSHQTILRRHLHLSSVKIQRNNNLICTFVWSKSSSLTVMEVNRQSVFDDKR